MMFTTDHAETIMRQTYEERLRSAELCRIRNTARRRSRVRSTLQRAIEQGLRHGIQPHEVEHEFTLTLRRVTSR